METNNDTKIDFSQADRNTGGIRKPIDEMDFFELMENSMGDFMTRKRIVESVITNVQKGDNASLKILERVLMEMKFKNEQKLIVSDDQLRNIILLAADRIRGQAALQTSPQPQ